MRRHKSQSDIFQVIGDIQMANFIRQVQSRQLSKKAKPAAIADYSALDPSTEDKSNQQERMKARTHLAQILLWHDDNIQSS